MLIYDTITAIAGLGVMLYGLRLLNSAIEGVLGFNFRKRINQFANNRFKAIGTGIVATTALQSSHVFIAMMIGLVNVGIITLFQALSMTLGSAVGSTLAIIIVSFKTVKIVQILTLLIPVGVGIAMFCKKPVIKKTATILNAIGLLCLGLVLIGDGTSAIAAIPEVSDFFKLIDNPFFLLICGILLALLVQSLFSSTVVIATLAGTVVAAGTGAIGIESACFMIFGANIGTAISTWLIMLKGLSINGKRVLFFHLMFKIIGAVIFSLLMLTPWLNLIFFVSTDPTVVLILVNIIFNLVTVLLFAPFVSLIEKLVRKIIPDKKGRSAVFDIFNIEDRILKIPSIALKQIEKGLSTIVEQESLLLQQTLDYLLKDPASEQPAKLKANNVEKMIRLTTNNMIFLTNKLNEEEKIQVNSYLGSINDAEVILNSCRKMLDQSVVREDKPRNLLKKQIDDIKKVGELVHQVSEKCAAILQEFTLSGKLSDETKLHELFDVSEKVSAEKLVSKHNFHASKMVSGQVLDYNLFFYLLHELGNIKDGFTNIAIKTI